MKNKTLTFMIATIFVAVTFISCSNIPSDEVLKQMIAEKEKAAFDVFGKNFLIHPCGYSWKIEIPKMFTNVIYLNSDEGHDVHDAIVANEQIVLDNLAMAGVIAMNKTRDTNFINVENKWVKVKEYTIAMTAKGDSILLGQTGDNYMLSLVDLSDVEILTTHQLSDDTLKVDYKRKYTSAFNVLKDFCKTQESNYLVRDTSSIKLVRENKNWKTL